MPCRVIVQIKKKKKKKKKLHWVCGKHFMNVERLPFITLSAIFPKIAAATHRKRTKSTISSNLQS